MDLVTSLEADKDLIRARERYIRLTERPGMLVSLADTLPLNPKALGNSPPQPTMQGPAVPPQPAPAPTNAAPVAQSLSVDANEELLKNIAAFRLVFNYYELLAIGIQTGTLDYKIYRRFAKSQAVKDWDRAAPLIFALRQKYAQPSMYHEYEELVRWLRGASMPRRRRFLSLLR